MCGRWSLRFEAQDYFFLVVLPGDVGEQRTGYQLPRVWVHHSCSCHLLKMD